MSLVFRSEQFLGFLKRSPLKNPPQATYRWYQCYIKTVTIFEHCQIERLPDIDILAWFSGRRFLHSDSVFIRRWWWWWSELGSRPSVCNQSPDRCEIQIRGYRRPVPFNCHQCWSSVNYLMIVTFSGNFSLPVSLPRAWYDILKCLKSGLIFRGLNDLFRSPNFGIEVSWPVSWRSRSPPQACFPNQVVKKVVP